MTFEWGQVQRSYFAEGWGPRPDRPSKHRGGLKRCRYGTVVVNFRTAGGRNTKIGSRWVHRPNKGHLGLDRNSQMGLSNCRPWNA
jgi:hypothetical protein